MFGLGNLFATIRQLNNKQTYTAFSVFAAVIALASLAGFYEMPYSIVLYIIGWLILTWLAFQKCKRPLPTSWPTAFPQEIKMSGLATVVWILLSNILPFIPLVSLITFVPFLGDFVIEFCAIFVSYLIASLFIGCQ
jgi:hypothetical protein